MNEQTLHQNEFRVVPYIRELSGILPPDSLVLDMGSWEGNNGNYLAEEGHRVVSVELDKSAALRGERINRAVGRSISNSFVNGNMLHPMFADETFDAVISTIALQDLVPKAKAIKALGSLLDLTKPGGLNLTRVYIGTSRHQAIKSHKYSVFAPGELQSIYSSQGWEFVKEPFQTRGPLELTITGGINSVSQVFARKPLY